MKVAQGNELAVDVVGMRPDDVVKRLKGLKVSKVSYRKKAEMEQLKLFP
jgi:hypothetical protein